MNACCGTMCLLLRCGPVERNVCWYTCEHYVSTLLHAVGDTDKLTYLSASTVQMSLTVEHWV